MPNARSMTLGARSARCLSARAPPATSTRSSTPTSDQKADEVVTHRHRPRTCRTAWPCATARCTSPR
ncbi:MAG: hypothetical protein MZV64_28105 [Ignavibacteriales bacterium]|nr:hypothetical protein [Ignavibacteriales bacterium]